MESLEQLHKQLHGLNELRTIVKTMKTLSAASIHQYEEAVRALAGYYQTVERGLYVLLKDMSEPTPPPHSAKPRRLAAIIFGSDHGLCGRFNEEITGYALERMDATPSDPDNRILLAVGARMAASLENAGHSTEEDFLAPGSALQITATVQQILLKVDEWRETAGVHYVYLFYNRHTREEAYHPTGFELLPVNLHRFHRLEEDVWPSRSLPTYSMDRDALFRRLLQQYLFVTLFRACAESQASEHASRLRSMQAAQRNIDERIEETTQEFRRARQTVITAELLDVVTGFETTNENHME
jgi:F-type H+-transporting ATPase subunit gamma